MSLSALVTLYAIHYMPHAQAEAGSTRPLKSTRCAGSYSPSSAGRSARTVSERPYCGWTENDRRKRDASKRT